VVAGWVYNGAQKANDVAVVRFAADGTLDAAFGTGGEVQLDVSSGDDHAWNLALDAGGGILVVGRCGITSAGGRLLVLRLQGDGDLDTAFGDKGIHRMDASLEATGRSISVDAKGRVVAAGDAQGAGDLDVVVLRLRGDGSPDPTLGGKGHVLIDLGRNEHVRGSTLDAAGRLLVTGWLDEDQTTDSFILRVCQ
jgi:uncharacterized delta-60 repeat protein